MKVIEYRLFNSVMVTIVHLLNGIQISTVSLQLQFRHI